MHRLHRYYSCCRKLRHDDYLSALNHASGLDDQTGLIVYPCGYCGGLHVGHGAKEEAPRTYTNTLEKRIAQKRRKLRRLKSGRRKLVGVDLRKRDEQIRMVSEYLEKLKGMSAEKLEAEVLTRRIRKTKKRLGRAIRALEAESTPSARREHEETASQLTAALQYLLSRFQALPALIAISPDTTITPSI